MSSTLSTAQQADALKRGFSRRSFGKLASVLSAGAALPFYNERALAQLSMIKNMRPERGEDQRERESYGTVSGGRRSDL